MKSPTFTKIVITKTYACPISGIAQVTLFAASNGCKRLVVTTRFSEQGLVFARTRSSWSLPEDEPEPAINNEPSAALPAPQKPPSKPAAVTAAEGGCAKQNEPCFDMEKFTYTECCNEMKCLVDKSPNGDFGTKCVSLCEYIPQNKPDLSSLYERVINIISSFNRQAPVNVPSE